MGDYFPTIGLEVHAELKTRTKMFCDSLNDPDPPRLAHSSGEAGEKHPNQNVCPVCLAHPGTLPVINKKAVEGVIKVGLALGGRINPVSKFDRKNYFYPDLPKGYQISQYDQPLVEGGMLNGVHLTRIHLEEDTGTLIHSADGKTSIVDFNRAGVPLMELVTEPDITTAEEAVRFGKELRLILRYLGVSDADMEKGQMRLEANISLSQISNLKSQNLGTKVEVKNINSFKALGAAIEYEIARQREVLEKGQKVIQETRGWDDVKQRTVSQRLKEEAHDYRYFPEPDLPPMRITHGRASPADAGGPLDIPAVFDIEDLRRHLPELPTEKRERFKNEYTLSDQQIELLISDRLFADYFEEAASELKSKISHNDGRLISAYQFLLNYLVSDLRGLVSKEAIEINMAKISPEHFAHLIALIDEGKILSRQAKDILKKMFDTGGDPEDILESEGLHVISGEDELAAAVREIISENPAAVADFKKGKTASIQFLIGKAMAKLKGKGNPEMLKELFERELRD